MTDKPDFIGTGNYYGIMDLARKYNIGYQEAKVTILRFQLRKMGMLSCTHPPEQITNRRDSKAHCKWCWTFMEVLEKPQIIENTRGRLETLKEGKYKPIKNKLEEELEKNLLEDLR